MRIVVFSNHVANPAPLDVATIASHVVATTGFVNGWLALWAFGHLRIYIMQQKPSFSAYLARRLVVRVTALEASLCATFGANCAPVAAATRSTDDWLTAWLGAPLELAWFAYTHILLDHIVLLLNFVWAELLDFFQGVAFFTPKLHAR